MVNATTATDLIISAQDVTSAAVGLHVTTVKDAFADAKKATVLQMQE
jgi:hypothetical protein